MILTITKKVILVLDVVAPLLLVATSLAASGAIAEILMFYDFYRPDPVFPGEYFIFFGLAFFVVTFLYLVWVTPTTLRLLVNLCFPSLVATLVFVIILADHFSAQMRIGAGIGFILWLGVLRFLLSKSMHYYACFWAVFSGLVVFNLEKQYGINPILIIALFWPLFVPQFFASITALGLRDFWLSHLRPRAMSRGMSVTNIRLVELYAPMIIAMTVFFPSLNFFVNSF
jgi:hypothetical protein|tara:strand:- start:306 stop:989 length:684 start_codon:yes stop_codon:yes gene_type:complete